MVTNRNNTARRHCGHGAQLAPIQGSHVPGVESKKYFSWPTGILPRVLVAVPPRVLVAVLRRCATNDMINPVTASLVPRPRGSSKQSPATQGEIASSLRY